MKDNITKEREALFREKAGKVTMCFTQDCPLRAHCLRSLLCDYLPEHLIVVSSVNLRNPLTQSDQCPQYLSDVPLRMPVGLSRMYYDMPSHLERLVKSRLIFAFSRKRYYEYHNGTRPITPDVEQVIRQTLIDCGWTQDPVFASYVEEYMW